MRKIIENRLINLTVDLLELTKKLSNNFIAIHLANQILRSSTSAALNYAEAQSAESRKDFIHKSSIVLKELRETYVHLKIIMKMNISKDSENLKILILECDELISIFYRSIETAKKNVTKNPKRTSDT